MKIGFDGKRAVCNNTGLGNYSRLLVKVLSNHYPDLEYALYTPEKRDNPRLMPLLTRQGVSVATPDKPLWKQCRHYGEWQRWPGRWHATGWI